MKKLLSYFLLLIAFLPIEMCLAQQPLDDIISMLNEGKHEKAQVILEKNLISNPDDTDSRVLLGMIEYHLGEWETAINIWKKGIRGSSKDYMLYRHMARVWHEQLEHHQPYNIKSLSQEELSEKTTFEKYGQEALSAYLSAYEIYPYQPETIEEIANIYLLRKDYQDAFVYFSQLADLYPQNSSFLVKKASCQLKIAKQNDFGIYPTQIQETLSKAIDLNSRSSEAYEQLALFYTNKNDSAQAHIASEKSLFYAHLPEYTQINFDASKASLLDRLLGRIEGVTKSDSKKVLDSLLSEPFSRDNADLMIAALAASTTDSPLQSKATNSLGFGTYTTERRKVVSKLSKSDYGKWLMIQLLGQTRELSITRQITQRLVKSKTPGMHDVLISKLPYDHYEESMHTAQLLAELGDERSKVALVKELYLPSFGKSASQSYYSNRVRQWRAAIALSNLKKREAENILRRGLENKNIRFFCAVSLFVRTKEEAYLNLAQKYYSKKLFFPEAGRLLKTYPQSKAQKLGRKLCRTK